MTASAWVMAAATWGVIGYFTLRFFIKVLRAPSPPQGEEPAEPGGLT